MQASWLFVAVGTSQRSPCLNARSLCNYIVPASRYMDDREARKSWACVGRRPLSEGRPRRPTNRPGGVDAPLRTYGGCGDIWRGPAQIYFIKRIPRFTRSIRRGNEPQVGSRKLASSSGPDHEHETERRTEAREHARPYCCWRRLGSCAGHDLSVRPGAVLQAFTSYCCSDPNRSASCGRHEST